MKNFRKFGLLFLMLLILAPVTTLADEGDYKVSRLEKNENLELLGQNTKYFKTVTTYDNSIYNLSSKNVLNSMYNAKSVTTEITEEEYNSVSNDSSIEVNAFTTVETTYKIMTTNLYKNGDYYRYENIVGWKNFPKVRDYDVIAIGFYNNVKPHSISFESKKCSKSNGCVYTALNTPQIFSTGSSATYILPAWTDLTSLKTTYIVDVEKVNPSTTIKYQAAFGDYAHSTTKVGQLQAIEHEVVQNIGILFDTKVEDNFDTIDEADVFWEGTW